MREEKLEFGLNTKNMEQTIQETKIEKKAEDLLPDVDPKSKPQSQQSISGEVFDLLQDLVKRVKVIEEKLGIIN